MNLLSRGKNAFLLAFCFHKSCKRITFIMEYYGKNNFFDFNISILDFDFYKERFKCLPIKNVEHTDDFTRYNLKRPIFILYDIDENNCDNLTSLEIVKKEKK